MKETFQKQVSLYISIYYVPIAIMQIHYLKGNNLFIKQLDRKHACVSRTQGNYGTPLPLTKKPQLSIRVSI